METITCWWCDEFTSKGKATGFCGYFDRPTWKSTVKKCQEEALANAGPFCYYSCPFTEDNEGFLCGEEGPGITCIDNCPEFTTKLCYALGGDLWHRFYYVNNLAEVVEVEIGINWGISEMPDTDLTAEYRWRFGWQRYYTEMI